MRNLIKYIKSAAIILACLLLGKLSAYATNNIFSGATSGMLLLFILLVCGRVKYQTVLPCSQPLLKYMPLLFIPTVVGMIEHLNLLKNNIVAISISVIFSCIVTLAVVGHIFQKINKSKL
ncbi:CidA/LrgA family protein [Pseudoalteromonas denitrificans]|uniref:Holin-like protein n=1 Tax=Pseudoalteromonas denitrificans DSM 6059 TaxID=1123010 RepID=A0A1I1HE96_9GAMM|nr:CidA/LrgA family protein [Pseudoalteromonas denitrificans]SFC22161.1 holin-like protein [Pseudoalteromonas denitrificans DSM 6059]